MADEVATQNQSFDVLCNHRHCYHEYYYHDDHECYHDNHIFYNDENLVVCHVGRVLCVAFDRFAEV